MKMLAPVFILACAACPAAQGHQPEPVRTCSQISLVRPGFGAAYRGAVGNDDYKFTLTIPEGLVGWGADPVAPFHGFTIFLPSGDDPPACIVFEIHLRVERGQREAWRRGTKVVIGGVTGWREEVTGTTGGTSFTNIIIRFSVIRSQETDDGTVRLVTPTKDLGKNGAIFEAFISHIGFYGQ